MQKTLLGVVIFFGVLLPHAFVDAATLYLDPTSKEINRGDVITLAVRLDTDEGECINTIDAVISYSENIQPIDTSRGSSILSMWIEEPTINKKERTITFAGGIPNGYCGRIIGDPRLTNKVVELVFSSPGLQVGSTESGNIATIAFAEGTRVLLNDGFGTDASLRFFDSQITLNKNAGGSQVNEWSQLVVDDVIPPEKFSISLERTKNAFDNHYFIVFNTTDKQSGIDYYEVLEEPLDQFKLFSWGGVDAPWIRAKSPYELKDQSLNSTIMVRAYDKAGNEYVATLVPEESQRSISAANKVMIALLITAGVVFVGAACVFVFFLRRRKSLMSDDMDEEINYDDDE